MGGRATRPAPPAPGTTGDGIALAFRAGAELVDMECVSFQFPGERVDEVLALREVPIEELLGVGAAHYFLGGVRINEKCETAIPGLYAAGETTGGLFGAARLGGSAMSDLVLFGTRAGQHAAEHAKAVERAQLDAQQTAEEETWIGSVTREAGASPEAAGRRIRQVMWRFCGTMKTEAGLTTALAQLEAIEPEVRGLHAGSGAELREALETRNMLAVGRLVATASALRQETRGCFWRVDYPVPDNDNWVKNIILSRGADGIQAHTKPPVMTRLAEPIAPRIGAGCFGYLEG